MSKIHLQLVTPERTVLREELDSLSCPTDMGQITILPHHIPLVAALEPGELVARAGGKEHFIHIAGGFVEIRGNSEVTVLADAAEHHHEIDVSRAQAAVERAKTAMAEKKMSEEEYAKVAASLQRGLTRINVARKHAHRRPSPITGEGILGE